MAQEEFRVDPQQLKAEALKEPRRRGLEDYHEVIRVLKEEKGFSLREVAAWLRERGLDVDHNTVWRTYSKGMERSSGSNTIERFEHYEHQQTQNQAMPWL